MTIPFLSKSSRPRTYADIVDEVTQTVRDSGVRDGAHGTLVADPLALRCVSIHRAACCQAVSELGPRPHTHVLAVQVQAATRRVEEARRCLTDFRPLERCARAALGLGATVAVVAVAVACRASPELVGALGIAAFGTAVAVTDPAIGRWWLARGLSLSRRRFESRRMAAELAEAGVFAFDARVDELVARARVQIMSTYAYAIDKGERFVEARRAALPASEPEEQNEDSAVRARARSGRIN